VETDENKNEKNDVSCLFFLFFHSHIFIVVLGNVSRMKWVLLSFYSVLFRGLFPRKEKNERKRIEFFFLLFFSYVNVFLTKAEGEKWDGTHTHTGGSVNRLLVVSDEQVTSKCATNMQKRREKKMRRIYIDVKHW